jgi:tetratricopeptide (TPR) repeat protein
MQLAKTLAQKNPDTLPVNETYAALLMNTGKKSDLTDAVAALKGLVQKHPDDPMLHMDLARGYFDTNERDKSLNEAQEAIQQELKQRAPREQVLIPARIIAGRIYEDHGQHSKALQMTDLVLQIQPANPDARLIRDRALFATGQSDQAQSDLESLVQQYPQMNDARVVLGDVYASKKKFDQASAQYTDAWKSSPPDMRGFLGLQTVKVMEGKGADAVGALQQLVDKNPKVLAFRYQLANFEAQTGMQAIRSDPAQAKMFLQEAADNYKQILKTTTNSAEVWLRLGTLQRALGQYDASLASFEQASSADPHDAQAFLNEGVLLDHDLGKKKDAAAAYNKVLGIDPENAVALNNLAFINAENGSNLDQAESFAERAKQKVPNSPTISDTLGYVYYRKNLNGEALRIFKQIVEQEPANPTFRLHLAMALLKQGNKQGAKEEAEKALKSATLPEQQNQIRSFVNQIG